MPIIGPNGQEMDPAAMDSATMGTLPPDAFAGASAADMAAMPPPAMGGMTGPMMGNMPPPAMGGMGPGHMEAMPPHAMGAWAHSIWKQWLQATYGTACQCLSSGMGGIWKPSDGR